MLSKQYSISIGVKQGRCLSATHFFSIFNDLIEHVFAL